MNHQIPPDLHRKLPLSLSFKTGFAFCFLLVLFEPLEIRSQQQRGMLAGIQVLPENLIFVGNKSLSSEELRGIFRNAGTVTAKLAPENMDTYDTNRISHAIEMLLAFYRNQGFIKARIELPEIDFGPKSAGTKIRLVLKITENNAYQLGQVKVNGARALDESLILSMLNLRPKGAINFSKMNSGTLAVKETYLTLGYLDVDIKTSLDAPDGKKVADLRLDIIEGHQYHLGQVRLAGHSALNEKSLQEFLPFKTGDIFGRRAFEACLEDLNELGITPVLTADDVDFNFNKEGALVDVEIHLEGKKKKTTSE